MRATSNPKFFEQTRFRYTWIADSKNDGFGINKAALSTTVSLPFFQQNHWRLSPGFNWNFWSGPDTATTGVDLPSQAYEFYLDSDFITNPCRNYGAEIDFSIGVYSDFKNMNSDSIRFMGVGLGWFRINEHNTFKVGVEYFDRVDIKLLPAFGLFYSPSPDVRFDIYFPRPRIAQRVRRVTTYEVWVYAGGEYGGDSWTVERFGGLNDRIDVNDVRAYVGGEWTGAAGFTGFFEFGYVFNRELVFESIGATNPVPVSDSIMLRAGFSF